MPGTSISKNIKISTTNLTGCAGSVLNDMAGARNGSIPHPSLRQGIRKLRYYDNVTLTTGKLWKTFREHCGCGMVCGARVNDCLRRGAEECRPVASGGGDTGKPWCAGLSGLTGWLTRFRYLGIRVTKRSPRKSSMLKMFMVMTTVANSSTVVCNTVVRSQSDTVWYRVGI